LRHAQGLTQQALAAKTGLHVMYISGIERGQRNVSVLTLLRVAAALHLPAATLLQPLEMRPDLYLTGDPGLADN
jgi:transcriptional regulator with XRE-family HTH domain